MATFIITPDMRAEMLEGLAGCAYGSHLWKGIMPAFMPNPKNRKTKATEVISGSARICVMSKVPVMV